MARAIDQMHCAFGVLEAHTCAECINMRPLSTCIVYGDVSGARFKPYDLACGHFCVPPADGITLARRHKPAARRDDGRQMLMEDVTDGAQ